MMTSTRGKGLLVIPDSWGGSVIFIKQVDTLNKFAKLIKLGFTYHHQHDGFNNGHTECRQEQDAVVLQKVTRRLVGIVDHHWNLQEHGKYGRQYTRILWGVMSLLQVYTNTFVTIQPLGYGQRSPVISTSLK